MKGLINPPVIYLYRQHVDFRKSINGLAAIVESETDLSLDTSALPYSPTNSGITLKSFTWVKQALHFGINALKRTDLSGPRGRITWYLPSVKLSLIGCLMASLLSVITPFKC